MTAQRLTAVAGLGSLALLVGAWMFQHLGGLAPCALCVWQRYPHGAAVALAALAMAWPHIGALIGGAIATLATAGIGAYHVGVEQGLLPGPNACAGGGIGSFEQIMSTTPVLCDDIAWSFGGISMAGWNALISTALCALWILAIRRHASSSASQYR